MVSHDVFAKDISMTEESTDEQMPASDGRCRSEGCGGLVVKKVRGLFREKFSYGPPACEKCGRAYFFAKNVPEVGRDEFIKSMNRPLTI